jgi:hypothetical protein
MLGFVLSLGLSVTLTNIIKVSKRTRARSALGTVRLQHQHCIAMITILA